MLRQQVRLPRFWHLVFRDLELEQEARLREIESHLSAAAALGKKCGVTESELAEMLRLQWEE